MILYKVIIPVMCLTSVFAVLYARYEPDTKIGQLYTELTLSFDREEIIRFHNRLISTNGGHLPDTTFQWLENERVKANNKPFIYLLYARLAVSGRAPDKAINAIKDDQEYLLLQARAEQDEMIKEGYIILLYSSEVGEIPYKPILLFPESTDEALDLIENNRWQDIKVGSP